MSVYENVRERMTVREFKPDPVPEPVVRKLLQAGRWAPSSRNRQPWRFIVVRDREVLARLGEIATSGRFLADAPLGIAILMEGADSPELDAGRALQQMEMVAWEEGLGTCFVGLPTAEQQRRSEGPAWDPGLHTSDHRPAVRIPCPDAAGQETKAAV